MPASISFHAKIHSDANFPPVRFVAIYGSSLAPDRALLQQKLAPLLSDMTIFLGDLNASTRLDDVSDVTHSYAQRLVWPWLRSQEESGALVDVM